VHNFDGLGRHKSGELPMETSRAVVRGRRERSAWLIVTQRTFSQELSNSHFIHLSHDRRELALSLVLQKGNERYACDLLLQDSRMSL